MSERPLEPAPTLLSLWYLAASLAERGDHLDYRHPLVAVRNSNNLVTGGLDIVRGEPPASAVIVGDGWWARAVLGTAAAGITPIAARILAGLWADFRGKANAVALLPPTLRYARIQAAATRADIPAGLAGRLLSWTDAVEEHFRYQPVTA